MVDTESVVLQMQERLDEQQPLVRYSPTEADIARLKQEYALLTCDTAGGYEKTRVAIRELVGMRTTVERKRVQLKAEALEYGRTVDREAKRITVLLLEVEEPLKTKKQAVDDEAKRKEREAAEAAQRAQREAEEARLAAIEAEARAKREAEAAAFRAEQTKLAEERKAMEAERRRIAEEQRVEAEKVHARLAEERRQMEAERMKIQAEARAEQERQKAVREKQEAEARHEAELQRVERERLAKEREKIELDRRAAERLREDAERVEFQRQAMVKAEAEAKARADRQRIEAEAERKRLADEAAAELARMEAMKPDIQRVHDYADNLEELASDVPLTKSKESTEVLTVAVNAIGVIVAKLRKFNGKKARGS